MKKGKSTKLVVLSGGLDSVTLLNSLVKDGHSLRALYIDIGYLPSTIEKSLAKAHCYKHNIPLDIIDARGIFSMVSGFVPVELLGQGELDKGQPTPIGGLDSDDYVCGYYLTLSFASYFSMLAGINEMFVGIIKEQIENTKGLSDFLNTWCDMTRKINPKKELKLNVPFRNKYKSEVIELGYKLGVDFSETWSCYRSGPLHCGKCVGCKSRKNSFKALKKKDPTKYQ